MEPNGAVDWVKVAVAMGAALSIGLGTLGPSLAQGAVGAKACESIGKYPEASDKIRGALLAAIVFIETSSLYALLVAILLIFFLA